jgi:uncharacterized protein with NRDE domain
MCLIAFAWKAHPDYSLVVAANRDEWHDRPASPAAWWADHPDILAGRDLKAGGTWLGISRSGRFAALTNFRDPADRKSAAPSRGELVSNFLRGSGPVHEYLLALQTEARRYQGFNLLAGDRDSLQYFSSRTGEIVAVAAGVHALSNHLLNEPWPKVVMAKAALDAAISLKMPDEARRMAIYEFLSNEARAADEVLPDTGVGQEWERILSPVLIVSERYGTRCSTVLTIAASGAVAFEERSLDPRGNVTGIVTRHFTLA